MFSFTFKGETIMRGIVLLAERDIPTIGPFEGSMLESKSNGIGILANLFKMLYTWNSM
jgi:hypothetical protein